MVNETTISPEQTTERIRCRKFNLADAMILLAGLALTLSMGSHELVSLAGSLGSLGREAGAHRADLLANWPSFWRATGDHLRVSVYYGSLFATLLLLGMIPVFLVVRLRRPRPRWRALIRLPGTVAVLAMNFGLFWVTGWLVVLLPEAMAYIDFATTAVAGTVATAWVVLALSRRWALEPGWVDRVCQLLGATAIGIAMLRLVIYRI